MAATQRTPHLRFIFPLGFPVTTAKAGHKSTDRQPALPKSSDGRARSGAADRGKGNGSLVGNATIYVGTHDGVDEALRSGRLLCVLHSGRCHYVALDPDMTTPYPRQLFAEVCTLSVSMLGQSSLCALALNFIRRFSFLVLFLLVARGRRGRLYC